MHVNRGIHYRLMKAESEAIFDTFGQLAYLRFEIMSDQRFTVEVLLFARSEGNAFDGTASEDNNIAFIPPFSSPSNAKKPPNGWLLG